MAFGLWFTFAFTSFGPRWILGLTLLFAFYLLLRLLLGLALRSRDWGSTTLYSPLCRLLSHWGRCWLLNTLFRTRDRYPARLLPCA